MALGPRVLKTGIAVTLTLYLSMLLKFQTPVIAAVAAIFAMQPSIYRSWRYFLDQLQTNTLGAAIAMGAGMILPNDPLTVGITCIVVIMICLKMKMGETIGLTLVTVIAVMEASGQWGFALSRFFQTLTGIGSAFVINILFFPPKPDVQFLKQIDAVFHRLSLLLRTAISDEIKESSFRTEQHALLTDMQSLQEKFKLFEEETKKIKRAKYRRSRQIVVYKQMLNTLLKGYEVLEAIENHYFQSPRSEHVKHMFDEHLELLTKGHEHVLLKLEDKVKPDSGHMDSIEAENEKFLHDAMRSGIQSEEGERRLLIVAAACYEYGFQIVRLDRLSGHVEMDDKTKG